MFPSPGLSVGSKPGRLTRTDRRASSASPTSPVSGASTQITGVASLRQASNSSIVGLSRPQPAIRTDLVDSARGVGDESRSSRPTSRSFPLTTTPVSRHRSSSARTRTGGPTGLRSARCATLSIVRPIVSHTTADTPATTATTAPSSRSALTVGHPRRYPPSRSMPRRGGRSGEPRSR